MTSDTDSFLLAQNEVMIALLARLAFGPDQIREIVTDRKRDPEAYVEAYNALDGSVGVVQAANIAHVAKGNMSTVLKRWQVRGIVYDVGTKSKPVYKGVLVLPSGVSGEEIT